MERTTKKENVLRKIRSALISKIENPFMDIDFNSSVYYDLQDEKEIVFAKHLIENGGNFIYCENDKAFVDNLMELKELQHWDDFFVYDKKISALLAAKGIAVTDEKSKFEYLHTGITRCEFLIARFGSVLVSSALHSGRRLFVYPEVHIVLAFASQVVVELKDAFVAIRKKYPKRLPSQMTLITGPSRTADIEKTLVMGAHGPRELFVFMVDDE